ncbi:MAG: hypothetical protein AAF598_04085 [Bacteroidota bacterium]
MSVNTDLGYYSFLPWLRQGLGNRIAEPDHFNKSTSGPLERANININVTVNQTHNVPKQVKMIGPGDILGVSRRAITRVEPKNGLNNFESNYLPYIEFYEEDFLWRYTPAIGVGNQLRPWLALVVAKDGEVAVNTQTDGLPYFTIEQNDFQKVFYEETQSWAWAHVHLNQPLLNNSGGFLSEFVNKVDANPDDAVCRLIAPRKLDKSSNYTAFLIPAFETGRLAGLGEATNAVKAQLASWNYGNRNSGTTTRSRQFPIYYQWSFQTGELGDFETLANLLVPYMPEVSNGGRPMNIEQVGFNVDEQGASKTALFEGALQTPKFTPAPWPSNDSNHNTEDQAVQNKLSQLLNLNQRLQDPNEAVGAAQTFNPFYSSNSSPVGVGDDPIITPPIYGKWHAVTRKTEVSKVGSSGDWINSINLDFRNRGAAGLGVRIIRENQEEYMERAWQQIGEVNEANRKIREAELAKRVAEAMLKKHIKSAVEERFITRTQGVHRILLDPAETMTVEKIFRNSRIPDAVKSPAFRKLSRPYQKTFNAGFDRVETLGHDMLNRMNGSIEQGTSILDSLNVEGDFSIGLSDITIPIQQNIDNLLADPIRQARFEFFDLIEFANQPTLDTSSLITLAQQQISDTAVFNQVVNIINNIQSYQVNVEGIDIVLNETVFNSTFGAHITGRTMNMMMISRPLNANETVHVSPTVSLTEQIQFLSEVQSFGNAYLNFVAADTVGEADPLNILDIRDMIDRTLIPADDIARRLKHLLDMGPAQHEDHLKPIMAYPKLNDPMYLKLVDLSQDYIIPNIESIPDNAVTLMGGNPRFIESFMLGLNHEFARELLWNEYPTDQRPSSFRAFWETKDNGKPDDDMEALTAIPEIHSWEKTLGENSTGTSGLVLIVRGELLRKYPNTFVYAQRAISIDTDERSIIPNPTDTDDYKLPIFQGELDPDIHFFGFDLEVEEAIEIDTANNEHGWFFCLKERPGQIRFGLDEDVNTPVPTGDATDWNDLSWGHLVNSTSQLNNLETIDLAGTIRANVTGPDEPAWGVLSNSADLAHILLQNPVLFAIHARRMISIPKV